MSYDCKLQLPAGFLIDVAYQKPTVKMANGNRCKCEPVAKHPSQLQAWDRRQDAMDAIEFQEPLLSLIFQYCQTIPKQTVSKRGLPVFWNKWQSINVLYIYSELGTDRIWAISIGSEMLVGIIRFPWGTAGGIGFWGRRGPRLLFFLCFLVSAGGFVFFLGFFCCWCWTLRQLSPLKKLSFQSGKEDMNKYFSFFSPWDLKSIITSQNSDRLSDNVKKPAMNLIYTNSKGKRTNNIHRGQNIYKCNRNSINVNLKSDLQVFEG